MTPPERIPPERTDAEEVIHGLRNMLFAIQCGLSMLDKARADEQAFKATHDALNEKLEALKEFVTQAADMLKDCDRIRTD